MDTPGESLPSVKIARSARKSSMVLRRRQLRLRRRFQKLSLESRKAEAPTDALQQADVAGASGIGLAGRQENKMKKKLKKRIKEEEKLTLAEIAEEYHDGNECRRIGEAMRQWAEEYEFQRAQSRRRQIVYEEDPLAHWHTVDVSPLLDSPPVTP